MVSMTKRSDTFSSCNRRLLYWTITCLGLAVMSVAYHRYHHHSATKWRLDQHRLASSSSSSEKEEESTIRTKDDPLALRPNPTFSFFTRSASTNHDQIYANGVVPPTLETVKRALATTADKATTVTTTTNSNQTTSSSSVDWSIVKHIDHLGGHDPPLYFAQWNHPSEADKALCCPLFPALACPGSVAIDIGAHGGDTTIPLAHAVGTNGLVIAFEPALPYQLLKANVVINSRFNIHAYNFAIDAESGEWCYASECNGCNGGRVHCDSKRNIKRLISHRLEEVLQQNYNRNALLPQISFIKIDAESYDAKIVKSLVNLLGLGSNSNASHGNASQAAVAIATRPVIQVEWFVSYQRSPCGSGTQEIFDAAAALGYQVYSLKTPFTEGFEWHETCRTLRAKSVADLYLFPKETPPFDKKTSVFGRAWRDCSAFGKQ